MNYIKLIIISLSILFSFNTFAFDCYGTPSFVKTGEYGAQESYVIVRVEDKDYRLGKPSEDTCSTAPANRAIPNSFQLIK